MTADESAARWGHRGGVLELTGPAELIDQIERSLFTQGVITARIDASDEIVQLHPALLEALSQLADSVGPACAGCDCERQRAYSTARVEAQRDIGESTADARNRRPCASC